MNPSLNKKWLGLISLMGICFTMLHCQHLGKQVVDGGNCNYTTKIYPAKLVAFTTYDSVHWDLVFERERDNLIDSFTYSYATKNYFSKTELSKFQIGSSYQWKEMKIIDGHCNPQVNSLIMQPYESTKLQ